MPTGPWRCWRSLCNGVGQEYPCRYSKPWKPWVPRTSIVTIINPISSFKLLSSTIHSQIWCHSLFSLLWPKKFNIFVKCLHNPWRNGTTIMFANEWLRPVNYRPAVLGKENCGGGGSLQRSRRLSVTTHGKTNETELRMVKRIWAKGSIHKLRRALALCCTLENPLGLLI